MNNLRDLQAKFLVVLVAAQDKRQEKTKWVDNELEWVAYEREEMYKAVNAIRPVSMDEIKRVEQCACGHVDYSRKFALYCAELALGIEFKCV